MLQRPTSPCQQSKQQEKNGWKVKNEMETHLNYMRCIQTRWMALAEARRCLVPCLLVLCPLNGLGFWIGL